MAEWALPEIDQEKCVLCGDCIGACPHDALAIKANALIFSNPQQCTYCGLCEDNCPQDAVMCYYEISWA